MDTAEARLFAKEWREHHATGGTASGLASKLGINRSTLFSKRRNVETLLKENLPTMIGNPAYASRERTLARFEIVSKMVPEVRPVEEIIEERLRYTDHKIKSAESRELIEVKLNVKGPFGIAMIGDPHIDSPGCNLRLLKQHTELINATDGMLAICVGDIQDGWVGRLARLWATQGIAAIESQALVDWWLRLIGPKLIALCAGNHDVWTEGLSGQGPMDWIRGQGSIMERHGVRLRLNTKDDTQVTINMRHDFPGRSQYNAAHGPNKSLLFGCRDDVAVAGHTHEFGRQSRLDPDSRKPMHAVRLGSYKCSDEYAREKGYIDNNLTECSVLMVDPREQDRRHRTWIEDNPFRAAKVLTMLRGG